MRAGVRAGSSRFYGGLPMPDTYNLARECLRCAVYLPLQPDAAAGWADALEEIGRLRGEREELEEVRRERDALRDALQDIIAGDMLCNCGPFFGEAEAMKRRIAALLAPATEGGG